MDAKRRSALHKDGYGADHQECPDRECDHQFDQRHTSDAPARADQRCFDAVMHDCLRLEVRYLNNNRMVDWSDADFVPSHL